MNPFLWEVQRESCPQEVLRKGWSESQLCFLCHKHKTTVFSLFTGLELLVTCTVVFQYVVKFCSEDGSWRYWFLISEGFTWSLEELGALGSSVEAGRLVKVTIWSHKLAHTFKIMVLSTTTGDKNMRNHYENLDPNIPRHPLLQVPFISWLIQELEKVSASVCLCKVSPGWLPLFGCFLNLKIPSNTCFSY